MTILSLLERCLVSFAPVITLVAVWPSETPGNTFAAPKIYGFAITVCLLSFLRLISNYELINISSTRKFLQDKRNIIPTLILMSTVGLSMSSVDPPASYFGDQNTQLGGFVYLLCIIYIFLCVSSKIGASYLPSLLISILISAIVIIEFIGFRPLSSLVEQKYTIKGSFPIVFTGYRGHLAGLLCVTTGLSMFIILKINRADSKDKKILGRDNSRVDRRNLVYAHINLLLATTCVFLISNTSAVIAIICMFFISALALKRGLSVKFLAIYLILITSSTHMVNSLGEYTMRSGWVDHTATSEDLSTTSTFETRLILWESAVNLFKQKPILGWGQNTYENLWYTSISKNKGDKLLLLELGLDEDTVFSRINDSIAYKDSKGVTNPQRLSYSSSHSAYFDLLYSSGLIGVASVILLLLYITRRLKYPLPSIAFCTPYLIYLLAWFPVSTNLLPFICLIGIILSDRKEVYYETDIRI